MQCRGLTVALTRKELKKLINSGQPIRLHLGCGRNKIQGYLNIDLGDYDVDFKMNLLKFPYPFPDSSVDEIIIEHTLEHFDATSNYNILAEFYRICKKDALIKIKVPYITNPVAFTDWDHKTRFNCDTFRQLCNKPGGGAKSSSRGVYIHQPKWKFKEVYR